MVSFWRSKHSCESVQLPITKAPAQRNRQTRGASFWLRTVSTKLPALFPWRDRCALYKRNSPVIQPIRSVCQRSLLWHRYCARSWRAEARMFLANVFCRNVRAHASIDRGVAALCGGEGRYTQLQSRGQFRDNPGSLEERKGGNFFCLTSWLSFWSVTESAS
jgi:hypothetical protein